MTANLKYAFLQFVQRYRLVQPGQRVLLAVSGGVDSMVLWHLFRQWQKHLNISLGVAHVHHHLRGSEADADAQFVQEQARQWKVPFYLRHVETIPYAQQQGLSLEEAARILREKALKDVARENQYDRIATGHHADDQLETILMRLFKGGGVMALAGIRRQKEIFIRPLLFAFRREIEDYARAQGLHWRVDRSNADMRFLRNRIRHQLVPHIRQLFGQTAIRKATESSFIFDEWSQFLEEQSQLAWQQCCKGQSENKIELDMAGYLQYFSGIQILILQRIIQILEGTSRSYIGYRKFEDFRHWLHQRKEGSKFFVTSRIFVRQSKKLLIFEKKSPEIQPVDLQVSPEAEYRVVPNGMRVRFRLVPPETVRPGENKNVEYLDAEKLTFPLRLRNWHPGDRFQPLGMQGTKLISDLLQETKIPPQQRQRILVLESAGTIVLVLGVRLGEVAKLTPQTRKVLKVEWMHDES